MQEIELKLRIKQQDIKKFLQHALLEKFAASHQQAKLYSAYYDTPELDLLHLGFALRVRKVGDHFIQTVKTAGTAENGLHSRQEWEQAVNSETPDLALLPQAIQAQLNPYANKLQCVFVTEFFRDTWQLAFSPDENIELALDQGTVFSGNKWNEPILEIELEIKQGKTAGLIKLAQELKRSIDLKPFNASKAERGYRLYKLAQLNHAD